MWVTPKTTASSASVIEPDRAEPLTERALPEPSIPTIHPLNRDALRGPPYRLSPKDAVRVTSKRAYVVKLGDTYTTRQYPLRDRMLPGHYNSSSPVSERLTEAASAGVVYNKENSVGPAQTGSEMNGSVEVIPMYRVAVTGSPRAGEVPAKATGLFETTRMRLQDTSGGAFYSIARGPTLRDYAGINSLVKTMLAYSGSFEDTAPLTRLSLMGLSQSAEAHKTDTVTRRIIANVGDITWEKTSNFSRRLVDNNTYYNGYRIAAVPLDIALAIGVNNEPTPQTKGLGAQWRYDQIDRGFQMVPIRSTSLSCPWALAYVAGHYHTSLWQGRTQVLLRTKDDDGTAGGMNCMPWASTVEVPGPKNIMLVLVDQTASSHHSPIRLSGYPVDIPVYYGPTKDAQGNVQTYNGADFYGLFNKWWLADSGQQRVGDCAAAYEHKCSFGAAGDACGLAMAAAAECGTAAPLGKAILPESAGTTKPEVAGLWRVGGGTWWPNSKWKASDWAGDMSDELEGFVAGCLSPIQRFRLSYAAREASVEPSDDPVADWRDTYQAGVPAGPSQATVTEVSSYARLAIYLDLYDTTGLTYKLGTADTLPSRLVSTGTALALTTSALLLEQDVSLSIWQGLNSGLNAATARSVAELIRLSTLGFIAWNDLARTISDNTTWVQKTISHIDDYWVGVELHTGLTYGSATTMPVYAVAQWLDKFEMKARTNSAVVRTAGTGDDAAPQVSGIIIDEPTHTWKFEAVASLDIKAALPSVYVRVAGRSGWETVWCDRWQRFSNAAAEVPLSPLTDADLVTTQCYVRNVRPLEGFSDDTTLMVVRQTTAGSRETTDAGRISTSAIMVPDPPRDWFGTFFDYVLAPVGAGIMTFLETGNPWAGLATGVTALAGQASKDLQARASKSEERKEAAPAPGPVAPAPSVAGVAPAQAVQAPPPTGTVEMASR